jgi:hypothetical protein
MLDAALADAKCYSVLNNFRLGRKPTLCCSPLLLLYETEQKVWSIGLATGSFNSRPLYYSAQVQPAL